MNRPCMVLAILISASVLIAAPPPSVGGEVIDKGSFKIMRHNRPVGAETFEISEGQDSLVVRGRQFLTISSPGATSLWRRAWTCW